MTDLEAGLQPSRASVPPSPGVLAALWCLLSIGGVLAVVLLLPRDLAIAIGIAAPIVLCCLLYFAAGNVFGRWTLAQPPTAAELAEDDGVYFQRPSDNKLFEYFPVGPASARNVIVLLHGSGGSGWGYAHYRRDIITALLGANTRLLSVSLPGYGASANYPATKPDRWLADLGQDLVALTQSLGAATVVFAGVSHGVTPALVAAKTAKQAGLNVLGVAALCSGPWSTLSLDSQADAKYSSFWTSLFAIRCCAIPMSWCCIRGPTMGMTEETLMRSIPTEHQTVEEIKRTHGDLLSVLAKDVSRGVKWYLGGIYEQGIQASYRKAEYVTQADLAAMQLVALHGTKDELASPSGVRWLHENLGFSIEQYEGSHVQVPLERGVQLMVSWMS